MKILVIIGSAVILGGISSSCLADGGNFFVNADAGEAYYHVDSPSSVQSIPFSALYSIGDHLNNSRVAGALRFGYRWHSVVDYGVEAGYADLGKVSSTFNQYNGENVATDRTDLKDRGWLLGGNLKYNLNNYWYVSARGGWYRSQIEGSETSKYIGCGAPGYVCTDVIVTGNIIGNNEYTPGVTFERYNYSQSVTGEYFGVGAGFNLSSNFSLGLSYDYYRSNRLSNGFNVNVGMYSLSAEYRF